MQIKLVVIVAFLAAAGMLHSGEFHREIPRTSWEPIFFETINKLTERSGLRPLREAPLPPDTTEIRIWIGLGLQPLQGLVIRKKGEEWHGQHIVGNQSESARSENHEITPTSGWELFWKQLLHFGVLTLPEPPLDDEPINDGTVYVVEINHANRYRTYAYNNQN